METVADYIFLGSKITVDGDWCQEIKRCLLLGRKAMSKLDSMLKKQRHCFADKSPYDSSIVMCGNESWTMKKAEHRKNWCFQTVVLEKTLDSPLDSKEIKPFNLKGNQPWIFIGRTDAEAEASILWPCDMKS